MGSVSSVFVISARRYTEQLVPALNHLAAASQWPAWILKKYAKSPWLKSLLSAEPLSESLLDTLTSPVLRSDLGIKPGLLHREVLGCPPEFHGISPPKAAEEICVLFTRLVLSECGLFGVYFGRQKMGDLSDWLLENTENDPSSRALLLLRELGFGLMPFNDGTGGSLEGVCGRLSAKDCKRLGRSLSAFQHPNLNADTADAFEMSQRLSSLNEIPNCERTGLADLQALSTWAGLNHCDLVWINDPVLDQFEGIGRVWQRVKPLF